MLRDFIGRVTGSEPDFPTARIVNLGEHSVVFETTNSIEDYRANELGGERSLVEKYIELLEDGMIVWDVGANIGVFSLFAARANAQVHSFEPDPGFAKRLRRNIYLNGQDGSITIHEMALNDTNGQITLYTDGVDGMSPGLSEGDSEDREEVVVDQQRGDALNLQSPDLLKIDVEGAEGGVIRGMTDILESIDMIVVELHQTMLPRFGDEPKDVKKFIVSHGFSKLYEKKSKRTDTYCLPTTVNPYFLL